jgi:6-methylsalicylic acid synthase
MSMVDRIQAGQSPAGPEPVAVVGIGCRFAGGADSPDSFWELLRSGRAATGEVPEQRWAHYRDRGPDYAAALRRATTKGAFLDDIEGFDAEFFGLSPREAGLMDPQQRILLEVSWEALEHAGIPPAGLAGADVGVFVGVGSDDYGRQLLEDLPRIEAWTGIGAAMCAVANRISYALDLRGPSLAVDTACSASLVATHLACQSLRLGESTVALAAGVNLIVSPGLTLTLDAAGALAQDGRSKSFDAAADGYGRGEGCGVLVLKRLADARRDGDRILSVILGSAVNQDGRTNGIMAPSEVAQEHVLDRACRHAGIAPASVDYVEAHGTGTRLGDPLEAAALNAVYGAGRTPDTPCLIGSVKSNIGHLEAAAGVAGLIKTILSLANGEIPASLNYSVGNPAIDWDGVGLRVVSAHQAWPRRDHPRRAGVSGFGYGGTVAHVVLEQAPDRTGVPKSCDEDRLRLFPLSAASPAALRQQAGRLADWLCESGGEVALASLGHTLALRRSHLAHRAVVLAGNREQLVARLRVLAGGGDSPEVITGRTLADPGTGLVWVLSGHGSHWAGMGRELLSAEPVFAAMIDRLEPVFVEEIGFSPRQVLTGGELGSVDRIQAMIFVMQLGLAEVWRSYGVRPDAVIGHSVGEIAAAVLSGALSVEDGARLICRRSRLLVRVAGRGAMVMAALPFEEVRERLAGRTDAVAAISSSPSSTVVSGDAAAIEELLETWRAEGVEIRRVTSDVAFHSPHMDELLDGITEAAADLSPGAPDIVTYTTALADPRAVAQADGAYWAANLRDPVRLAAAVEAAAQDGYRAFLEVSGHPVVAHSIGETLSERDTFVGSTLRRKRPERAALLVALAAVHCHGIAVDWARLAPGGELVTTPQVAWQHRPHWTEGPAAGVRSGRHDVESHALLGSPTSVSGRSLRLWQTVLDDATLPYPGSHTVDGVEIVPAAVLINSFLQAVPAVDGPPGLDDVALLVPLTVSPVREVQVVHDGATLRVASRAARADGERAWLTHTTATVAAGAATVGLGSLAGAGRDGAGRIDPGAIERHLASVGVPTMAFSWTVEDLVRGESALRARIRVEQPENAPPSWAPVLDAALSAAPLAYPGEPVLRMVAHVGEVRLTGQPPASFLVDVVVDERRADTVEVLVADVDGRVVARLSGLRYAVLDGKPAAGARPEDLVHELVWRPLELADRGSARGVVLVAPEPASWPGLCEGLVAAGVAVRVVGDPDELGDLGSPADVVVLPPSHAGLPVAEGAARCAWLLTRTGQAVAAAKNARLWVLTSGVRESQDERCLPHAALWGLGRIVSGEHPESWGGVVDLDPEDVGGAAAMLPAILRAAPGEDVIAVRDGTAMVARLAQPATAAAGRPLTCRADGTYLITGGLGVLGIEVARWLAGRGARRIVLAGRRPFPARASWDEVTDGELRRQIDGVRGLEALGVTVRVVSLDIADAGQAASLLAPDVLGLPPIRGVVHAAGVLDNRLLATVDEESLRTVLRPKVDGAWVLHELFPPGSLDFLALFSSCGQLLALPGQATYGAANAFLDALAAHRRTAGHDDTVSFGWTSWRGMGMAVNEVVDLELRVRGVADISPEEAFGAWDHAWRHGAGYVAVLRAVRPDGAGQRPPVLSELAVEDDGQEHEAAVPEVGPLAELPEEELRARLLDEVRAQIAAEMRLPATDLDLRRSLSEQGLDSVMTIVIRRRLEKRFGHSLPATLFWQQPTVTVIADHLVDLVVPTH